MPSSRELTFTISTEGDYGVVHMSQVRCEESSLGEMSVRGVCMGQIICPECKTSLTLSAGPTVKWQPSRTHGSPSPPASETGTEEWSITYKPNEGWIIASAITSSTLTDQQISSLKQLLGYLNLPWPASALAVLLDYAKASPGRKYYYKSTTPLSSKSPSIVPHLATSLLYEITLPCQFPTHPNL